MTTARTDDFTGTINAPGDVRWGMGKVDAYTAIQLALQTEGLSAQEVESDNVSIYPNPASSEIFVRIPYNEQPKSVTIIAMHGQQFSLSLVNGRVDISSLASGVYVLRAQEDGEIYQCRIVVQ